MKPLRVAVGAIERDGRFFLQRRSAAARRFPGLWEFPGGKVEAFETPAEALVRELAEEIEWVPDALAPLPVIHYAYPGLQLDLCPFLCHGPGRPATALAWAWFTAAELAFLPMPEANRHLLPLLERRENRR